MFTGSKLKDLRPFERIFMFPGMDNLPPLPDLPPGNYRHYKGGEYEVVGVARHSETLEPMVVYRPLYNATGFWVRPFDMFTGLVVVDGHPLPRFQRMPA